MVGDTAWAKVAPPLPGKASDCGVTAGGNRLFPEAVLWPVRAGLPWRDLPGGFGLRNSVFRRSRRRARTGAFDRAFERVPDEPDFGHALTDGTIVSTHRKASGARGARSQAIRRSGGGATTGIVAPVDALGNPVRFALLPGQRRDTIGVPPPVGGVAFGALLGDKAIGVGRLRAEPDARGAVAVILPEARRRAPIPRDRATYRRRHPIENCFAGPEGLPAVAARHDKAGDGFRAAIDLAAAVIASRWMSKGPSPA